MGESFFFPLYQARKYVLTSWYCNTRVVNPSAGKGSPEGDANVRQYVFCPRVVNPSAGKGSPEGDANVRQYVCFSVPGHY
jgi:hypothetical protein